MEDETCRGDELGGKAVAPRDVADRHAPERVILPIP